MSHEKSIVYLILRLVTGSIFIYHGYNKLGSGYSGWKNYMQEQGFNEIFAIAAIVAEILIGIALILGIFTKIFAIFGALFMVVAWWISHRNDPILGEKGISYQITLFLLCICLALHGGGKFALTKN
jgi:putative oxidoreductase